MHSRGAGAHVLGPRALVPPADAPVRLLGRGGVRDPRRRQVVDGPAETLLELGSGGGNNASHLKARFTLHAHRPLARHARAEPDAQPRVRAPRGRHADAAARPHLRRRVRPRRRLVPDDGGRPRRRDRDRRRSTCARAAPSILTPDATTEIFEPRTKHGGHDGDDGRSLRYLEWAHPATGSRPTRSTTSSSPAGPGDDARVVHDRHTLGVFPRATWERLVADAGLELVDTTVENPYELEQAAFVAPPSVRLTTSEKDLYPP